MERVAKLLFLNDYLSQNLGNGIALIEFFTFIDIYLAYFAYHRYLFFTKK